MTLFYMSHLKKLPKINRLQESDSVKYIKFCVSQRNWEAMLDSAERNRHITTIWRILCSEHSLRGNWDVLFWNRGWNLKDKYIKTWINKPSSWLHNPTIRLKWTFKRLQRLSPSATCYQSINTRHQTESFCTRSSLPLIHCYVCSAGL